MKYLLLTIGLFLSLNLSAQDREKKFSFFGFTDPVATKKDGFNIGVGINYQMSLMYFEAKGFVFPDLRGNSYYDLTGTVGFNKHLWDDSKWFQLRVYAGGRGGKIWRDSGHGGGTIGGEIGFDWNIPKTDAYIGFGGSDDLRTDGKAWGEDEHNYWRKSGWFRAGIRF